MTRVIVGVLRGGTSGEYNLSLKTGATMMQALPEEKYEIRDILIDRSGMWHLRGVPSTPARALSQVDVVLNALHGGIGEDGTVQRILDRAGIPYAGSRALGASLSLNKVRSRETLLHAGIRMPQGFAINGAEEGVTSLDMARAVFERFGPPYIVKPVSDGGARGIRVASSIVELPHAIADVLEAYGSALIEEFVRGEEVSVGVIEGFRNEPHYALPPAQVLRSERILMPDMHESGSLEHAVPSPFTYTQKLTMTDMAKTAHKALGLSHFSRADLIVTPRAVYLIEMNAIPGLYPGASFPSMLESVGSSIREFLEHSIALARA